MKKLLRITLISIGLVFLSAILFILASLKPIDRTFYRELPHYPRMMDQLDSLAELPVPQPLSSYKTGFAKENLTPRFPVATAGYGRRRGEKYTAVHDSIFVRSIVLESGNQKVAIVSADLLIIPPKVTEILQDKLLTIGFSLNNTFLNATHTHNSIGNWGEGATGLIYGSYSDSIVTFIADKIIACITKAASNLKGSTLRSGSIQVPAAVRNRLDKNEGEVDSLLHVIEITREDSIKMVMVSFNAHATCLFSNDLELSRDYPGVLVDDLEKQGYQFAMYLSGAVGSHGTNAPESGKPCLGWMANEIMQKFLELKPVLRTVQDSTVMMVRVPLFLGDPQIKISENWRIRPWVFRSAFGEYQPYLTALRLGNVILLGTPCDFSGSLTKAIREPAEEKGYQLFVTSFNGHYIGYITADRYYDQSHYETRLMNWYGPGNGAYFTECLSGLQKAVY